MTKATIWFMNNGEEFELPEFTQEDQEIALEMIVKKMGKETKLFNALYSKEMNKAIIYQVLKKVDKNLNYSDLGKLHTAEFNALFNAIYVSGLHEPEKFRIEGLDLSLRPTKDNKETSVSDVHSDGEHDGDKETPSA